MKAIMIGGIGIVCLLPVIFKYVLEPLYYHFCIKKNSELNKAYQESIYAQTGDERGSVFEPMSPGYAKVSYFGAILVIIAIIIA